MTAVIDVIGEALVDLVIDVDGSVSAALGGAPMNTARTCGRLGLPVRFCGALSADRFGTMLRNQLVADHVDVSAAVSVDFPTTLAAAEIDADGAATYRFYVEGTSAPAVTSADLTGQSDLARPDAIYTGGLALVLDPLASAVETALTASTDVPGLVMVDVNCRPLLIADRETYVARLTRVLAAADVVKVSDEDLAYLSPELDPIAAAQQLLAIGPAVVLVTRGGEAVNIVTRPAIEVVDVPSAEVVDTIGAGDSFSGGFLSWWIDRGMGIDDLASIDSLRDATTAATRVAAIVVGRRGADPPWRHEVAADFAP